ncbi:hypothetical protein [Rubrivivax rivuli]|uniref:Uncharacterized protein n=1 Tax=Rubrivivax rivuli TaxID=1862385 RepID=A0A437RL22_9BURK|nr:hypothetical protein [Rubrivivax rivuli]RVU47477.1 hypothetical protein EOE66_06970 [Rubrivivax rivuli]
MASKKSKAKAAAPAAAVTPRIIFQDLDPVSEAAVRAMIQALGDGSPSAQFVGQAQAETVWAGMNAPVAICASPYPPDNPSNPAPNGPAPARKAPGKKAPKTPADKPKKPPRDGK